MVTVIEPLAGTDESEWAAWPATARWPVLDPARMAGHLVVVLAAHPDDEVLGVGGLVHQLAARGARLRFVWATDGEASHPGSVAPTARDLASVRRTESAAALRQLGADAAPRVRLGMPDGGLAAHQDDLARRLRAVVPRDAVVLAPWSGDGHPDHEACGAAARRVSRRVLEYPVWAWHWASPDDPRVPWARATKVLLPAAARAAKQAAVTCFASQVAPIGPDAADGPVLPERVLAHFARNHEVLLS
jgi:LmbE family N-acetylglucosaminyl deacetylase